MFFRRTRKKEAVVTQVELEEVSVPVESGIDSQEMEDKFYQRITNSLQQVNSLLKYITEMDYVKDMLLDVSKQTDMIQGVAASSQEMTAAIEDVSNFVQTSNLSANESVDAAETAIDRIEGVFSQIEVSYESSRQVQVTMAKVNEEAERIHEMVGIIKGVADQTNLLALNASIEAARAGEHGRGFAVVADEIKKLADNTKMQVEFITEVVNNLTSEVQKADAAMEASGAAFDSSKDDMAVAVEDMNAMRSNLKSITANFMDISANIEEQTAASQEMSSAIAVVNEKAQVISDGTDKTGMSFNSISKVVDDMRMELLADVDCLDAKTQIEICVSDHLAWRWRVYNMILGYEQLSEEDVGTHHTCRLGKWVDNADFANSELKALASQLSTPHEKLHQQAKTAIAAYNSGNEDEAERMLESIDAVSGEVVSILNKMKRVQRNIDKAAKKAAQADN